VTVGLAYILKTSAFWIGSILLARSIWFLARRSLSWRSAVLAVVFLGLSAALPGIGSGSDAFLKLPAVLPILPTEYLLLIPSALFSLSQAITASIAIGRERKNAFNGLFGGTILSIVVWNQARQSPTKVDWRGGVINVSMGQALVFLALALCGIFAIAAITRKAESLNATRNMARGAGLLLGSLVFGLPLVWMLITSFREDGEINAGNGVRWIPVIQVREPYLDSLQPYYSIHTESQDYEGVVLSTQSNGDKVIDIRRPLAQIGQTVTVPLSSMKQIPEMKPMVTIQGPTGSHRALDLETLLDGRHRLHVLDEGPSASDLVVESSKISPVQERGLRIANYSDSIEFLPPETLHGLIFVRNTLIILALSVIGAVMSSSIVAFAMARLRFPAKKFFFGLLLSTMMLPAAVTMMPQFLIFRNLGWVDTLKPMWVPAFFGSAFNIFMLRQFFASIPKELEEAASIDGCSIPRIFWSVALPQIIPALATIALWTAIGAWNNFTGPLIYISSPENMPISYAVQLFQGARSNEPGLLMAFVTMSVIPVVLLFLFAQRYFIQTSPFERPAKNEASLSSDFEGFSSYSSG
jgi:multiple sugar transport system permease protein